MKRKAGVRERGWALGALWMGALALGGNAQGAGEPGLEFVTRTTRAAFHLGTVRALRSAAGRLPVQLETEAVPGGGLAPGIHTESGDAVASAGDWDPAAAAGAGGERVWRGRDFPGFPGASATLRVQAEESSGDLVLRQECQTQGKGVWGVSWALGGIPLDFAIVVPGNSGLRLTRQAPGKEFVFDYPMGWEAGLVIVEGPEGGFAVWADDAEGRYKRLVVRRSEAGWSLRLITLNYAPFQEWSGCDSVAWRLHAYEGDWRVPARRYRDWMERVFRPVPLAEQRPAWVRDTRAMVITGMSREILEELPKRFDPAQTVLYLPDWRAAGYDRDYPVYDRVRPELDGFLERAHGLGFRVMLHVNYFGVDPLNPLYARFEPHQVRSPWGKHEKEWWLWTKATPEIKFAYVNPALKAWRECFVAAMVKLCREHRVDALHLDQTLCIYNDHNGLIEGASMIQGNIQLHRELREALPDVALSGEGLNEVTFRHEAFAQRHARGLHHAEGTWDRQWLALAHPVSSYLFRPYVIINGYLGYVAPDQGQLYAAWNEAYEHWGVIPTLKPTLRNLRQPEAFARQFHDEAAFWLQARLDPDLEGDWPDGVAFPFRGRGGVKAARLRDGSFVSGDRIISRTVTGVNRAALGGGIPGWFGYDRGVHLGLDPAAWYPWFPEEPDPGAFHVCEAPEGVIVEGVVLQEHLGEVRLDPVVETVADLAEMLDGATVVSRPFDSAKPPAQGRGSWMAPDGGGFSRAWGARLAAHPPYKGGSGEALARYGIDLPAGGSSRFRSGIVLEEKALEGGRSDGVTFTCVVRGGGEERRVQAHHASESAGELELDLAPFAGKRIELELCVGPGPARSPSFDWARWLAPRIERMAVREARVGIRGGGPWRLALGSGAPAEVREEEGVVRFPMELPGSCILLREKPAGVPLPLDLTAAARWSVHLRAGEVLRQEPSYVSVGVGTARCGGVQRRGFSAHPPDRGETVIRFPMTLGKNGAVLRTWAGLRDDSTSTGVVFRIEVNGQTMAERSLLPGGWQPMEADLQKWRGQPVLLSLVTDSDGPHSFDWAWWGEPRLETGPGREEDRANPRK